MQKSSCPTISVAGMPIPVNSQYRKLILATHLASLNVFDWIYNQFFLNDGNYTLYQVPAGKKLKILAAEVLVNQSDLKSTTMAFRLFKSTENVSTKNSGLTGYASLSIFPGLQQIANIPMVKTEASFKDIFVEAGCYVGITAINTDGSSNQSFYTSSAEFPQVAVYALEVDA